jgi:hypothetical protein
VGTRPSRRTIGEEVRSAAFAVEYRVTAVGEDSVAARITGEARSFRHPRSPLERAVNRLLYALVALVVGLGALLGYSLYHRHVAVHTAGASTMQVSCTRVSGAPAMRSSWRSMPRDSPERDTAGWARACPARSGRARDRPVLGITLDMSHAILA